jgi:hypothetical protein
MSERVRDSSLGRAALDRWSRFRYLPRASKIRFGVYAAMGVIVLIGGAWRLSTLGGAAPEDATLKKAEQIRQQAAVEPPPPVETSSDPGYTGPEPRSVKGGARTPR